MRFRAAYVSYADYGGPLIHTKEFVRSFKKLMPDLVTYCPELDKDLSYQYPGDVSFTNKLFAHLPQFLRQLKLEFYQLRKLHRDFMRWRVLFDLYKKNNVDIVVIRNDSYVIDAVYATKKMGIPYILETNGILSRDSLDRVTRFFEKYVLSKAAGIFSVSPQMANIYINLGVPENKIRVIPNGVALDDYVAPDQSIIPDDIYDSLEDKIVIGYVGTFTPNHDVEGVIVGFSKALTEMPTLRLLLIGEGRFSPIIKKMIKELCITNQIILTGKTPHAHVPAYLALCHITANPMRQTYEEDFVGVPIKMFEYMAAKKPIVSTDMPILRQMLGGAAIFVGTEQEWRDAFLKLAMDEEFRCRKGEEAYAQLIKRGYTWDNNAIEIYGFCEEILENMN